MGQFLTDMLVYQRVRSFDKSIDGLMDVKSLHRTQLETGKHPWTGESSFYPIVMAVLGASFQTLPNMPVLKSSQMISNVCVCLLCCQHPRGIPSRSLTCRAAPQWQLGEHPLAKALQHLANGQQKCLCANCAKRVYYICIYIYMYIWLFIYSNIYADVHYL